MQFPDGLVLQSDVSPAGWIVERLWPWNAEVGVRVGAIAPEGFEAYARILHSFDGVRWADLALRSGTTMHATVQFAQISGDVDRRISREGSLSEVEAASLSRVLAPFGSRDVWGCIWEGFGFLSGGSVLRRKPEGLIERLRANAAHRAEEKRQRAAWRELDEAPKVRTQARGYLLFRATIDDVARTLFGTWFQSFNLWWPDDRTWCVATEIDFDSTLVGGSRACIDAVLMAPDLEAFEITLDARLDSQGDTVNL